MNERAFITPKSPVFSEDGTICGKADEITPEFACRLGYASAHTGMRIAVGHSESGICKLLAYAYIAGAGASGAQITETDASFFAVAAHVARNYFFNLTVFFENDNGRIRIRILDKTGLAAERAFREETEKKLFSAPQRAGFSDVLMPKTVVGTKDAFASASANRNGLLGFRASVSGRGGAAETLRYVLSLSGAEIVSARRGVIAFSVSGGGDVLSLRDEREQWYDDGHVTALLAFVFFLSGGRELAVSAFAPSVLDRIADEFDAKILRIGRDAHAREVFMTQNIMTDAMKSAVFLGRYLFLNNTSVSELMPRIPDFTLISREISLLRDRDEVLSELSKSGDGLHKETGGGLRVCADGGWVSISPSRSAGSLRITGEGMSEEIASELCDLFIEKAKTLDNLPFM